MAEGKKHTGSRILELRISQFMRLRAVSLRPKERGAVVVSGRNAQGKSSLLAAIRAAAGGKRAHPQDPIRTGAQQAEVVTVYGRDGKPSLFVRLLFVRGSEPKLIVEDADGVRIGKPQEAIDRLLGAVAFDPLEFVAPPGAKTPEAVAKAQREQLLRVLDLGIDIDKLEEDRATAFRTRTDVTRAKKQAEAAVAALGADEAELDAGNAIAAASRRLLEAEGEDRAIATAKSEVQRAGARLLEIDRECERLRKELLRMEGERARVEVEQLDWSKRADAPRRFDLAAERAAVENAQQTVGAAKDAIRRNAERRATREQVTRLAERERACTVAIEQLDATKADAFARAKMPVAGLSIDADGVKIVGPDGLPVPFAQASWAQKIVVSCRVAMAAHPDCNTMALGDGNALDADSFEALARIAEAEDYQLWIERVAEDVPGAIVIDDGAVAGVVPGTSEEEAA